MKPATREIIFSNHLSPSLKKIAEKIFSSERISLAEGIKLFYEGEIGFLGALANFTREKLHGKKTFFNRNFHIEPTNLCVFDCKFCSYSRLLKQKGDANAWELSEEEILQLVKNYEGKLVTEIHIVGGVHPKMGLNFFANLLKKIKEIRPDIHLKAF